MASLMKDVTITQPLQTVSFHTDTLYDLLTGIIVQNNGLWYVDGGYPSLISGVGGYTNAFKSTIVGSLIMRSLVIYPDSEFIALDTENALIRDLKRLQRFASNTDTNIMDRVYPLSGTNYDIGTFFTFIKDLCQKKLKNKKDYIFETPFIDVNTGKCGIAWIPTYVLVDSLTEFESAEERELFEKGGLDDGKTKTSNMVDGLKKTQLMRIMRKYCERYGIVFVATSQIDQTIDMGGPYSGKPKKQMQHMKMGDVFKNTGTAYKKLASTIIQANSAKILKDDTSKECWYPKGNTSPTDVNEVIISTLRCKTHGSGMNIPLVVSQADGLLNPLTHYHYLKQEKYGIEGTTHNKIELYPEVSVTRKTIREKTDNDLKFQRALQISAEVLFMKKYYNSQATKVNLDVNMSDIYKKFKDLKILDDILTTRGYWTYDKTNKQKYCSTLDILTMIEDNTHIKKVLG